MENGVVLLGDILETDIHVPNNTVYRKIKLGRILLSPAQIEILTDILRDGGKTAYAKYHITVLLYLAGLTEEADAAQVDMEELAATFYSMQEQKDNYILSRLYSWLHRPKWMRLQRDCALYLLQACFLIRGPRKAEKVRVIPNDLHMLLEFETREKDLGRAFVEQVERSPYGYSLQVKQWFFAVMCRRADLRGHRAIVPLTFGDDGMNTQWVEKDRNKPPVLWPHVQAAFGLYIKVKEFCSFPFPEGEEQTFTAWLGRQFDDYGRMESKGVRRFVSAVIVTLCPDKGKVNKRRRVNDADGEID